MHVQALATQLDQAVCVPRVKGPTGTIWMPEEPFSLEEAVAAHLETEDEHQLFADKGSLRLLAEDWPFEPLLDMYWEGDGESSPSFRMGLLETGDRKAYVCLALGAPAWWVVAAIEPLDSREYLMAFVKDFLEANGEDYSLTLFGAPPAIIHNLAPDRLSPALLKECFWEWMENAQDTGLAKWEDLRDELLQGLSPEGASANPGAMLNVLGGLVQAQEEDDGEEEMPEPLIPVEECRFLLDLYFGLSYRSEEPFAGQEAALNLLSQDPQAVLERLRKMQPVS